MRRRVEDLQKRHTHTHRVIANTAKGKENRATQARKSGATY